MAGVEKDGPTPQEFVAPDWLNVALIQKALENVGDKRQVVSLSVRIATNPGDNYASKMYRAKVKLSNGEETSLVVKGPAGLEATEQFAKMLNIFAREAFVMQDLIPKMQAILEDAAPGKFPPLAARCLDHSDFPVDYLVLEDLAPAGFKMADRKRGLGFRHSLHALRALARFHAASHVLLQREPHAAERIPSIWRMLKDMFASIAGIGIKNMADAVRTWPGYEGYADMLDNFMPGAMEKLSSLIDPKPGSFLVIAHSDFWVNNMMFKYEDGYPSGIRIVDFAGSTVMTPAMDVIYLLSTSTSENVSTYHQELLVREYYVALQEATGLLGIKAPSFEELQVDINDHGIFGLMGAMNVVNFVKTEQAMDMDAMFAGNIPTESNLYDNPVLKKWLQRVLPDLARKGWLKV